MRRAIPVVAGACLALVLGLVSWRCHRAADREAASGVETALSDDRPSESPVTAAGPPISASAAVAVERDGAADTLVDSAPAPDNGTRSTDARPVSSGRSGVVAAVNREDPRDLALLSRIERELGLDPPAEVHAIVAARRKGASRDELLAKARAIEASDPRLKVLVVRWIDEVSPSAVSPSSAPRASGSAGRPLVRPLEPAGSN